MSNVKGSVELICPPASTKSIRPQLERSIRLIALESAIHLAAQLMWANMYLDLDESGSVYNAAEHDRTVSRRALHELELAAPLSNEFKMGDAHWLYQVFRLRMLPNYISSLVEAASLVSSALNISADHVTIYSLATTSNCWEVPPSKVATLQLKSVPGCLRDRMTDKEWAIPMPPAASSLPSDVLILDTHFEGMTSLNDVDPSKHSVDCIAISGLGSHAFGSWQPRGSDKSFMWIRDVIPRSLPTMRALVYGYDSKILGSSSFQSISDIALNLIHQLKSGGWNLDSSKPIVFLAHSLGGLVLKEAIVQMADRDRTIGCILDHICGAIMFGVPSMGMQQSHLMAMVEGQANALLIEDLSRENGSSYLRQLNKRFDGVSFIRKARIIWAYETKESPTVVQSSDGTWNRSGSSTVLVTPESATSRYATKDKSCTLPINADHSNMVKFSRGDANLGPMILLLTEFRAPEEGLGSSVLQSASSFPSVNHSDQATSLGTPRSFPSSSDALMKRDQAMEELDHTLTSIDKMKQSLYSPELGSRIKQIEDPFDNTFSWIFSLPVFCNWLQTDSGLFWIHGKPGSGKSTLMKFIYGSRQTWELLHNWRRDVYEIKAGYFFHYRGTTLQKSFEGLLRSVILQIMCPHYDEFLERHQPVAEEFQKIKQQLRQRRIQAANIQGELQNVVDRINTMQPQTLGSHPTTTSPLNSSTGSESPLGPNSLLQGLKDQKNKLQRNLESVESNIDAMNKTLSIVADKLKPYRTDPKTQFLRQLVSDYFEDGNWPISKLEKILRSLLDQDIIKMDIVLFFDALDEFDGHIDMISRFLINLVKSPSTPAIKVKVCFSSRPWKSLQNHFSNYPGFSLQHYTRDDIEAYVASSLVSLRSANPSVVRIIPAIIKKASGVFLWVKLAVKELLDSASSSASLDHLVKKLQELPEDLQDFYDLIVERISQPNRRRTFALLELLVRQDHELTTVIDLWQAVLLSNFSTFQESAEELRRYRGNLQDKDNQARNDISTWGGGLVEIQGAYPQLMHQTVFQFVTDLSFARTVLGDIASILTENGHSFHAKYWITVLLCDPPDLPHRNRPLRRIFLHSRKSEETTGNSQLEFFQSISFSRLSVLFKQNDLDPHRDFRARLLQTAVLNGLSIFLRDWIVEYPSELNQMTFTWGGHLVEVSLLSFFINEVMSRGLIEKCTSITRLLLANGYRLERDPDFFTGLLLRLRAYQSIESERSKDITDKLIPETILLELATLALEHGQDPNLKIQNLSRVLDLEYCRPLHMAPLSLTNQLIRCGADPNATGSDGRTPLDWCLDPPKGFGPGVRNIAHRYELCKILAHAGGNTAQTSGSKLWADNLAEFDSEGFDTQALRESSEAQRWNTGGNTSWYKLFTFGRE